MHTVQTAESEPEASFKSLMKLFQVKIGFETAKNQYIFRFLSSAVSACFVAQR